VHPSHTLALIVLLAAPGICARAAPARAEPIPALAEPIVVRSEPVAVRPADPAATRVGGLEYRGGLRLTSPDRRFGGLSGLRVAADGRSLVAVSDHGYRLAFDLVYDGDGRLVGAGDAEIEALRGPKGGSLAELPAGNAEALAPADGGGLIIAFEIRPRLLTYPPGGGVPVPVPSPPGLDRAPDNEGIEALTRLRTGRLLALTEGMRVSGGNRGWIGGVAGWWEVTWRTSQGFQPTGAATLPDGDVLVLERRILPPGARVRRLAARDAVPGAVLDGTEIARLEGAMTVDNMEGIDARRNPAGEILVYLISDDNYAFYQRTLLMMFRLLD
jgi:hypothetical protein